jgi:hypothetical protein
VQPNVVTSVVDVTNVNVTSAEEGNVVSCVIFHICNLFVVHITGFL